MVRSSPRLYALIAGDGHGVNTVRRQSGAAIFPCYSSAAARSRVAIGEHRTAARSAGLQCYPTQGGAELILTS
jgi:hypothetical protein